jgi:serine phosphatase RsbU (regulator of sigma subunit)
MRYGQANVEVQIGAAKVPKYAVRESGDSIEIIERPRGGISAVLVDGQRSGRAAKIISNIVARKAISLLGEGVRDGAVARAAHDYLRTHREGQVSAELQVVSVDLVSNSLVISRNTQCPVLIQYAGQFSVFDASSQPIGIHVGTKPVIMELPLQPDTYVVLFTDGVQTAGDGASAIFDWPHILAEAARTQWSAQALADHILALALQADQQRPKDDVSVLVVAILAEQASNGVRRLSVSFPVESPKPTPSHRGAAQETLP